MFCKVISRYVETWSDTVRNERKSNLPDQVTYNYKQEYIPLGCVPSAAVAVCPGGLLGRGALPRGVSAQGCLPGGVSAQGVSVSSVKILPCPNYVADGNNNQFGSVTLPGAAVVIK